MQFLWKKIQKKRIKREKYCRTNIKQTQNQIIQKLGQKFRPKPDKIQEKN